MRQASMTIFARVRSFASGPLSALIAAAFLSCGVETAPAESASDRDLAAGTATLADDRALVLYAAGEVFASPPGGGTRREVAAGDFLEGGLTIATGAESTCDLQFGERAVVRIDENSEVRLEDLLLKPGAAKVGLYAAAGTILCKVEKIAGNESFRVRSKTAVCGVRGTEFEVTVAADAKTILAVKDGRVSFLPAGIDPERLADEAAGGDPVLADGVRELAAVEQVVAADQESEMSAADAARAAEQARALEADIRQFAGRKTLAPAERERVRTRFLRFRDNWRRDVRGPRRMDRARRERLKIFNELRRRRVEVVPRRTRGEAAPRVSPEGEKPPAAIREEPRPSVSTGERSENLLRIEVTVEPRQAAIFLNGRPAGRGRFQGLFAVGESLAFDFKLAGFVSQSLYLDLHPEVERVYRVSLQRGRAEDNPRPERRPFRSRNDELGPDGEQTLPEETPAGENRLPRRPRLRRPEDTGSR